MTLTNSGLQKFRKAKNLTLTEVAEKMNVTRKTVEEWEDDLQRPDLATLRQLAELYAVPLEDLIYRKGKYMELIKQSIRDLRKEKNMTQDALAEKLNVTRQAVSNWETGKTQPDIDTLVQLSEVFDVSIERVIYGKQKRKLHLAIKAGGGTGLTAGAALAMIISYTQWHSIGWAILHGVFGWFYVIYYLINYGGW